EGPLRELRAFFRDDGDRSREGRLQLDDRRRAAFRFRVFFFFFFLFLRDFFEARWAYAFGFDGAVEVGAGFFDREAGGAEGARAPVAAEAFDIAVEDVFFLFLFEFGFDFGFRFAQRPDFFGGNFFDLEDEVAEREFERPFELALGGFEHG